MTEDKARVADLIRKAFLGVELGDGVGLWQAQGIDDYEDAQTIADYRARDEKVDWSAIPAADVNRCYSSLSFFDAEGMRFHLPAYLIADLEGKFEQDVIFHLTNALDWTDTQFSLFSDSQRNAVREFLLLRLSDPDCDFERPMIEDALSRFWTVRREDR